MLRHKLFSIYRWPRFFTNKTYIKYTQSLNYLIEATTIFYYKPDAKKKITESSK